MKPRSAINRTALRIGVSAQSDDLAAARVAELHASGEQRARVAVMWDGLASLRCVVVRGDGRIEDVSAPQNRSSRHS